MLPPMAGLLAGSFFGSLGWVRPLSSWWPMVGWRTGLTTKASSLQAEVLRSRHWRLGRTGPVPRRWSLRQYWRRAPTTPSRGRLQSSTDASTCTQTWPVPPANDALLREFYISLGCALENLVLAARADGHQPTVTLDPGNAPDLVATVDLEPGPSIRDQLYESIGRRRSNRSEYTTDPVGPSTLMAMDDLVDGSVAPAGWVWLDTEPARQTFAHLLDAATVAHVADEEQSEDSFAWWRSSWGEVQAHRDGLNIDGVGLPPLITTLAKILPAPSRESADATFVERTRLQADTAAAFGVVTVDDPHALEAQLVGGRLLQRLHLWATANDLGFQHMNQITERIDRDRQQDRPSPF